MASIIKVDTIQSTTANVFFQNSSGTEYARFDSSGNLGIGAASPNTTTKFYVEQSGGGNVLGYFNSTATAQNARLRINSTDNASSVAYVWSYSHASLNKQASMYLTSTGALAVQAGQTAGSEPTSGTTSAILNQYGIGLGGTNPSSGAGIAFPATQSASSDANTLDDYEEGTWTPTLTFGGGTTGITYSTQSGTYVKIGRLVWLNCRVALTAKGSSTGSARITGIPFPGQGGSGGGEIQVGSVWYNSFINASNYHVNVRQDATNTGYMELRTYSSGNEAQVNEGWFNNTSTFSFTLVYYTNQ